ncbi:hypothetical protein HRG_013278 [Hirsutella rhossiliensis]
MEIKSIFFALLLLVQVSPGLTGTAKRSATVHVDNKSQNPLEGLSVVHKYSDVFVDKYTINRLAPGSRTEDLKVEYHTGFWTTGGDWWKICWTSNNATTITYTDPNNFRGAVDWFEKSISDIIPIPGSAAGGAAGFLVGKVITGLVANQATTAGFKQHILREGDHDTSIVIEKDGSVTFQSPSGVSTTTTTTLEVTDKLLAKHRKELENESPLNARIEGCLSACQRRMSPGASPFSFFLIKPSLQSNTLMADSIPSTKACRTASRRSRQINSYRRKNLPYHMEDLRLTVSTAGIGEPHAPLSVRQNKLSYPRYVDKDCHY